VQSLSGATITPVDRHELEWLDGLLGVMRGDSARVERARQRLAADTAMRARNAARSLAGHWLSRTNSEAGADTLRASAEDVMRTGGALISVMAVDRFVIARALRRRGTPAEAERYLMWIDAATNSARNGTVHYSIAPLVNYERGLALEEAGNRPAAAYRLRRFVTAYDQPPAVHRALVDDAKRRLAQLERSDVPAARSVTPR
jgi:hypothetical protein